MLINPFLGLGLAFVALLIELLAYAAWTRRILSQHQCWGLYGIGNGIDLTLYILANRTILRPVAMVVAGIEALIIYMWWKGGGGDGTKRRLRSLARKFIPVRRTAPQASS